LLVFILMGICAKTPKYYGHYRYFFLVITITELRYAALTLTLMNIEKGFHSVIKESLTAGIELKGVTRERVKWAEALPLAKSKIRKKIKKCRTV